MNNKIICANCDRDLDIGVDVIQVEEGVIGTRGFVPLDCRMYFCGEKCLQEYFDVSGLPSFPKRIP